MPDDSSIEPFFEQLCQPYSAEEIAEIQQYLTEWDASTYVSVAHSILDHATRKNFDPLKYLRKAHNFSKKRAIRIPSSGYRSDSSAVYRQGSQYLIVRLDGFGQEKIVSYGVNDDSNYF